MIVMNWDDWNEDIKKKRWKENAISMLFALLLVGGLIFYFLGGALIGNDRMYEILQQEGLTQIEMAPSFIGCCGRDDYIRRSFTAINRDSRAVEGCICGSGWKGFTIRYK